MDDRITITRKIEVRLHRHGDGDEAEQYLKDDRSAWIAINNKLYKAANRIVSYCFFNDAYEDRLRIQSPRFKEIEEKLRNPEKYELKESDIAELKAERNKLYDWFRQQRRIFLCGEDPDDKGRSVKNATLKVVCNEFRDTIPCKVLSCLNSIIRSTYSEYCNEIKSGSRTIFSFKKGLPVPFPIKINRRLFLNERPDGSVFITFPGGGKVRDSREHKHGMEWDLVFGRDRSNNREIVDRILDGTYDVGNSSIQQARNGKNFLLLAVEIPRKTAAGNPDRVVGIDLGINIPLYAALNDNDYAKMSVGSRDNYLKVRQRMSAQSRELQSSLRSSTNGGRGRKHKLQALERLKDKERNWVRLQNHIFSKSVIEFARKNNAGAIQMERIIGFGRNKNDGVRKILNKWSYSELQQLIEYKALAAGIEVRYVDPYLTSQTCSFCGHYEPKQRVDQSHFICRNPQCEKGKGKKLADGSYGGINADWNAARNIAKSDKVVDRREKQPKSAKTKPAKPAGD